MCLLNNNREPEVRRLDETFELLDVSKNKSADYTTPDKKILGSIDSTCTPSSKNLCDRLTLYF